MKSIVQWVLVKVNLKWSLRFCLTEPVGIKKMKWGLDVQGVKDTWAILTVSAFNDAWTVQAYAQVL
jgi:hypothetical protein